MAALCGCKGDKEAASRAAPSPTAQASNKALAAPSGSATVVGSAALPATSATAAAGPLLSAVEELALGARMDCARKSDATVWCWEPGKPAKRQGISDVQQIAVVQGFVCAIHKGKIACTDTQTNATTPITLYRDGVVLAGGPDGYCVRTEDGVLRCGLKDAAKNEIKAPSGMPGLKNPSEFAIGPVLGCAVLDADVWCWNNAKGAGIPKTMAPIQNPQGVAVGQELACSNTKEGEVQCYPAALDGKPRKAEGWTEVAALSMAYGPDGRDRLCAMKRDGSVWCAGLKGEGAGVELDTPSRIEGVVDAVALGTGAASHRCARTKSGNVWCWERGQASATAVTEAP